MTGCPFAHGAKPATRGAADFEEHEEARRGVSRRSFLGALAGAGAAALPFGAAGAAIADGQASAQAEAPRPVAGSAPDPALKYPFHGRHQSGILTPSQLAASYLALDVTATSAADLTDLFRTLTERARMLTTGVAPRQMSIGSPADDSGVLGPEPVTDGLTVTVSVGSSLFDDRFGLANRKPRHLVTMPDFANDDLDRARCDGDILIQVCAMSRDTVNRAVRDLLRATRGGMQMRWKQDGFVSPPRPSGTPRNLFGFKDGSANPTVGSAKEMSSLVWAGSDEPAWAAGGTYHVVRLIRMLIEFWDRIDISEQERIIGRRRDTGAPMSGKHESDEPDYLYDGKGDATPLDSHIRLANPRTDETTASRMLRRSYSYEAGIDSNGNLDIGLVFVAFNQNIERQFNAVQLRLKDEPMVDYISPFGGGYFFALPGVQSRDDYFAKSLLAA